MNYLFVCSGNTCRSPMAACVMNARLKQAGLPGDAISAGLHAYDGAPASQFARAACAENGLDISNHVSTRLTPDMLNGRAVLCMSEAIAAGVRRAYAYDDVFTLSEYAGARGDISDPYGGNLDEYRECFAQIDSRISEIIKRGGERA